MEFVTENIKSQKKSSSGPNNKNSFKPKPFPSFGKPTDGFKEEPANLSLLKSDSKRLQKKR